MVTWWKWLQVILVLAIILGISYMFVFVYETTDYALGLGAIVFGSIAIKLVVMWLSRIDNNIKRRNEI